MAPLNQGAKNPRTSRQYSRGYNPKKESEVTLNEGVEFLL